MLECVRYGESPYREKDHAMTSTPAGPDFSRKGTIYFDMGAAEFAAAGVSAADEFASDRFVVLPCTPLFYQSFWDQTPHMYDFSGPPQYIGKEGGPADSNLTKFIPKAICNCKQTDGDRLVINYVAP